MFSIETEKLQLKLEIVLVESLSLHEQIIPKAANRLLLEFKNLANLQNPIIVDENNIVLDGNHRVSVARQLGAESIQAHVWEFETRVPLEPDDAHKDVLIRQEYLEFLERKIAEHGLPREPYEWYLDLRRYGSFPHAGYGLGVERLVAWLTGRRHIRECVPFPRMMTRITP